MGNPSQYILYDFFFQLLEVGGNLYDAVSIAVKSALWSTQVPKIKSVNVDGSNVDIQILDDIHSCSKLDAAGAPIMVNILVMYVLVKTSSKLFSLRKPCSITHAGKKYTGMCIGCTKFHVLVIQCLNHKR